MAQLPPSPSADKELDCTTGNLGHGPKPTQSTNSTSRRRNRFRIAPSSHGMRVRAHHGRSVERQFSAEPFKIHDQSLTWTPARFW